MNTVPRKFYDAQLGSVVYGSPAANAAAGVVNGANNGLSVDATGKIVVLGQNVNQVGNPAVLISNREIPMNGFSVLFSGVGQTVTGIPTFKQAAAKLVTTPDLLFLDSAGNQIANISFPSDFVGDNGSVFIGKGTGASILSTANRSTAVGWNCGPLMTGINNTLMGYEAGFRLTTGTSNTCIGFAAMSLLTTGTNNTACGLNALLQTTTGLANTGVGRDGGGGNYLGSSDNVFVGMQCGLFFAAAAFVQNQNTVLGSKAFRFAANNPPMGDNNVSIGYGVCDVAAQGIGANNILIGANIRCTNVALANAMAIGQGITATVSNVGIIGRADQNIQIGQTIGPADNGARLQVNGQIITDQGTMTNAPGKWRTGKIVVAASVLNAGRYLETEIDGAVIKICVN